MSNAWKTWPLPEMGADLWDWQDGRCAMCGHEDRRLVCDHCHDTGFIRGLLCSGCNTNESVQDPDWIEWSAGDTAARAIGHLERYENQFRATPISPRSALTFYTHAEKLAWWESVEALVADGGDWPVSAPWTDEATARKDVEQDYLVLALSQMGDLLDGTRRSA